MSKRRILVGAVMGLAPFLAACDVADTPEEAEQWAEAETQANAQRDVGNDLWIAETVFEANCGTKTYMPLISGTLERYLNDQAYLDGDARVQFAECLDQFQLYLDGGGTMGRTIPESLARIQTAVTDLKALIADPASKPTEWKEPMLRLKQNIFYRVDLHHAYKTADETLDEVADFAEGEENVPCERDPYNLPEARHLLSDCLSQIQEAVNQRSADGEDDEEMAKFSNDLAEVKALVDNPETLPGEWEKTIDAKLDL